MQDLLHVYIVRLYSDWPLFTALVRICRLHGRYEPALPTSGATKGPGHRRLWAMRPSEPACGQDTVTKYWPWRAWSPGRRTRLRRACPAYAHRA
jgi:hypothetical protein